ncbi:type IV pilus secretin PilQ [Alcanivorax sp. JB21]|uniref:type IV pilus secretin PilQ family protein n=1 Tax=Alcanivorax limicola TaxID=2874102 RepID=UPI001CBA8C0A|nr:type IV pilus secretin PilQ family protein [Alcanivorax limicola]MBZ2189299.1 type IV pilus secretin PilQ [Alcanivorax limicola]
MKSLRETIISGRVIGALALSVVATLASAAVNAAVLQDVSYTTLPGNRVEVRLNFDGTPPENHSYSIEKPARIALDLMDTQSGLSERNFNLGMGNARSITVVEARDRTRLIVNLAQLTGYNMVQDGNDLVLQLGVGDADQPVFGDEGGPAAIREARESRLSQIDFRRGSDGDGRIVVNLSRSATPVDVKEEGNRIVARFVGAQLPSELRRRLDVTDFATPVQYVDARQEGETSVITIEASGNWEYLAYQADREFSISVKPVTQAEESRRRRDAFQYTGEKLSLNFQDIEVRSVLQLIADFTSLNLVASDTVTGRITLRLQNVPWDQALDLILKTKGLDKRQIGNVLLVAPADEIAAREQLELESQRQIESLAPLRSEYVRVNYARATDMEALIRAEGSLLSPRGSVTVDERTNTLILQDTDRKLDEIREVISTLDIAVQQVLIEARVVIATSDLTNELGVRWGGLAFEGNRLARDGRAFVGTGRAQNALNFGVGVFNADDIEIESPQELVVDLGVQSSEATRFTLGFVDLAAGILELELSALAAEGYGELVATPKVLTADQQPALIASGNQIGYQEATSSGATAVSFIDAELRLEVTPRITPEGRIIMDLKINNDSVGEVIAGIPSINTNRVETTVLVSDGETVVLGGIFQQQKTEGVVKTPFLGDLPWIGRLFRREFRSDGKQELLIFITPRLMRDTFANN